MRDLKERLRELNSEGGDCKTRGGLREIIKKLHREIEYREEEWVLHAKKEKLELEKQLAVETSKNIQLTHRIEESPYKQLESILKALVVKLPTLDIKEIHTHAKKD